MFKYKLIYSIIVILIKIYDCNNNIVNNGTQNLEIINNNSNNNNSNEDYSRIEYYLNNYDENLSVCNLVFKFEYNSKHKLELFYINNNNHTTSTDSRESRADTISIIAVKDKLKLVLFQFDSVNSTIKQEILIQVFKF